MRDCKDCKHYRKGFCYFCGEKRDFNVATECDSYSLRLESEQGGKDEH